MKWNCRMIAQALAPEICLTKKNLLEPNLIETEKLSNLGRLFCSLIKPFRNVNYPQNSLHLRFLSRNKSLKLNFYLLQNTLQQAWHLKMKHSLCILLLTVSDATFPSETSKSMLKATLSSSLVSSSLNEFSNKVSTQDATNCIFNMHKHDKGKKEDLRTLCYVEILKLCSSLTQNSFFKHKLINSRKKVEG